MQNYLHARRSLAQIYHLLVQVIQQFPQIVVVLSLRRLTLDAFLMDGIQMIATQI